MKIGISISAAFFLLGSLSAQINFEHEEWQRVKNQAKAEGKIVFVDAYTTWCGPCKWMAKNVFTDEAVGEFFNKNFINLKLDMEKGEGLEFAREYGVNAYPTLLFLNGDGKILHKHLGAVPVDKFLSVGHDAVSPEKRISAYIDMYDSRKGDKAFMEDYLIKMLSAGMDVHDAADQYFSSLSDDEIVSNNNLYILQLLQPSLESTAFNALLTHRKEFESLTEPEVIEGMIETSVNTAIYQSIATRDPAAYTAIRDKVSQLDFSEKDRLLAMGDMELSDIRGNADKYLSQAKSYSREYAWNDWNELNNLAWDMYLNKKLNASQMSLARKLAKRAVKLEANPYSTDTYAAVLYKAGKYKQALKWANTAVDLAKADGSDYAVTLELIEKIKAQMQSK